VRRPDAAVLGRIIHRRATQRGRGAAAVCCGLFADLREESGTATLEPRSECAHSDARILLPFIAVVAQCADDIAAHDSDPEVLANALRWKIGRAAESQRAATRLAR